MDLLPVSDQTVELDSIETRMGKKTIELHHIAKAFGARVILRDFDYIFLKNQNVGIVGPNGCGKSTLLRMIAGETEPDQGSIEVGETILLGYFAQEEQEMDDRQRVIDYVKDIAGIYQHQRGTHQCICHAGEIPIYPGYAVCADRQAVRR